MSIARRVTSVCDLRKQASRFVRAVISAVQMSFYEYHIMRPVRPFVGLDNYRELLNDEMPIIMMELTDIITISSYDYGICWQIVCFEINGHGICRIRLTTFKIDIQLKNTAALVNFINTQGL